MPRVKKIVETDERGRVSLKPLTRGNALYLAEVNPEGVITMTPMELTPLVSQPVRVQGRRRQVPSAGMRGAK